MSWIKLLALGMTAMLTVAGAYAAESNPLEMNKSIVVDFYNKAFNDKDVDAAMDLLGPTYTQHNARIPDGKEGLCQFLVEYKQRNPQAHSRIVRVFAEGDYVFLHVHAVWEPGTRGAAIMDIFRLENGKLVEHWDAVQSIPENLAHANTMF